MKKFINGIAITYAKQDEELLEIIANKFSEKAKNIMNFFMLDEVKNFKIKIWDNLNEFRAHYFKYNDEECPDWVFGHTSDDNINMLPTRLARLTKSHKDIKDEEIATVVCHEFVHICQQKTLKKSEGENFWFWEALATNLGNPEDFCWIFDDFEKYVHFDEITNIKTLEDYTNKGIYKYNFLVGNYMLKNFSHKQIIEFVKDESILEKNAENILKKAKGFYKNYTTEKTKEF